MGHQSAPLVFPEAGDCEAYHLGTAAGNSRTAKIAVEGAGNAYSYTLDIFAEGHEDENYIVVERLAKGRKIGLTFAPEVSASMKRKLWG